MCHCGIEGNENANELAKKSSLTPYIAPELALGVTKSAVRCFIPDWIKRKQREHWTDAPLRYYGKTYIKEFKKQETDELLEISRNQVRIMRHQHKMGLYNREPQRCDKETEQTHTECEALD